jgi:murein L,D-transpeptidase YafK
MVKRFLVAASLTLALAACQDEGFNRSSRHLSPIPPTTLALMAQKGMSKNDPIVIRSYKKEAEMEIWKRGSDGKYALLKTFPICRWSGQLGPKRKEGDRQAPEGFYAITPAQMNPNSAYYLSFDTGFPNAYDRAHGGTGSALMVHGSCSSRGCFAMTDQAIAEIYSIARESFAGGQRTFQFQSYPFRMTAENLAKHRYDPNIAFWKNLKEGSDYFEVTNQEPRVSVANGRYQFNVDDPSVAPAVAQKQQQDEQQIAELVAKGVQPIKLVYDDGGSHPSFRAALAAAAGDGGSLAVDSRAQARLGLISRPEGLGTGPQEIVLAANGAPAQQNAAVPSVALSFASTKAAPVAAPIVKDEPMVAVAKAPQEPVAAPASSESPFYTRMIGGIGDLFSTSSTGAPTGTTAQAAPATTAAPAKASPGKPQASAPTPDRRAQASQGVKVAAASAN